MTSPLALLAGWLLDLLAGDPQQLPHPIVWFGRMIAFGERKLNLMRQERRKGEDTSGRSLSNRLRGGAMAIGLILAVFAATCAIRHVLATGHTALVMGFDTVAVFYCLAGTTLIREVREVFLALDRSLDEGRRQVSRIVGRDTAELSAQEVRTAALETLAENLSDGVIAPLFWLALLGTPGMLAYKMVNTLDSMIGYRTERYRDFGCWAAHIDDAANYIPARLTALLMVMVPISAPAAAGEDSSTAATRPQNGLWGRLRFVWRNGRRHASPNSGFPEAALAAILNCRFGGPHLYFGERFDKPYIGENDRELTTADMKTAIRINRTAEVVMVMLCCALLFFLK